LAHDQLIPVKHVAAALGAQRKTVYRHMGRPMK
jgi:predicted DNA-binding transcriptional regulator AlpA